MFYHITVSSSSSFAAMWLIGTAPMFLSSNMHFINVCLYDDDDDEWLITILNQPICTHKTLW